MLMTVLRTLVVALMAGTASAQIVGRKGSVRSSISCTGQSSAQSYKSASDASVQAVANAIKKGCTGYTDEVLSDWESEYETGLGEAFAAAITEVYSSCESSGSAFGCAAAKGYATAYAESAAQAHADAAAQAFQQCDCLKTKAESLAFGKANTYIELIAEAESLVKASACAQNGEAASAGAYQKCIGQAAAKIFAKATADAFIAGDCYDSAAQADIEADTGADYLILEGCEAEQDATPGGDTSVDGKGTADATDLSKQFADFKMGR